MREARAMTTKIVACGQYNQVTKADGTVVARATTWDEDGNTVSDEVRTSPPTSGLPHSLAKNLRLSKMSVRQLEEEGQYWRERIRLRRTWGASIEDAQMVLAKCERELEMRKNR
jgi:hypothetical protein